MSVFRYKENPLITPQDVKPYHEGFEVIGTFNAGITKYGDEYIMLLRVAERPISEDADIIKCPVFNIVDNKVDIFEFHKHDLNFSFSDPRAVRLNGQEQFSFLTSLSYLRIARSRDGHHFTVDDKPFLFPETKLETFGIEDPRITEIDDTYYIVYSAVSPYGVGAALATTKDFISIERKGMIFPPENKDVVLFPEKINGKFYALHRPVPKSNGQPEIWIAESNDLLTWGNHRHLIGLRDGFWDSGRMGAGAPPIRTETGWLELYHGADKFDKYCMGAVLLDLEDPTRVIARTRHPILVPSASYEIQGFFGNVVFSCGAILEQDVVKMYYGVSDTSMACAEIALQDITDALCEEQPVGVGVI